MARGANREAVDHGERALTVRHKLTPDEVAELKLQLVARSAALPAATKRSRLAEEAAAHWRAAGDTGVKRTPSTP